MDTRFIEMPTQLMADRTIRPIAKLVLAFLYDYVIKHPEGSPSYDMIASSCGISRRLINTTIQELSKAGHITVYSKRHAGNKYAISAGIALMFNGVMPISAESSLPKDENCTYKPVLTTLISEETALIATPTPGPDPFDPILETQKAMDKALSDAKPPRMPQDDLPPPVTRSRRGRLPYEPYRRLPANPSAKAITVVDPEIHPAGSIQIPDEIRKVMYDAFGGASRVSAVWLNEAVDDAGRSIVKWLDMFNQALADGCDSWREVKAWIRMRKSLQAGAKARRKSDRDDIKSDRPKPKKLEDRVG